MRHLLVNIISVSIGSIPKKSVNACVRSCANVSKQQRDAIHIYFGMILKGLIDFITPRSLRITTCIIRMWKEGNVLIALNDTLMVICGCQEC